MDIYLLRSSHFFSRQSNPRDIWAELQLRTTEIRIHSYLSTLSQAGQPLVKKYKSPPLLCNFPPTLLIAKQHFTDKWFVTFDTFDQSDEKIWPDQKIPTYLPTYPPTHLCTSITEHPKGAILETCDLWDIWSEWWEDMTWPKNTYLSDN